MNWLTRMTQFLNGNLFWQHFSLFSALSPCGGESKQFFNIRRAKRKEKLWKNPFWW
jgi:hypothetical protein